MLRKLMQYMSIVAVVLSVAVTAVAVAPNCASADKPPCGASTFFDWGCDSGRSARDQVTNVAAVIFGWLSMGVWVAVLGGFIYGGYLYMTSRGNKSQTERGMAVIRNAAIALVLYYGMYVIINFLVPGGLFT